MITFAIIIFLLQLGILVAINNLNRKADKIMATQAEDAAALQKVAAQMDKISTEVTALLTLIQQLKDAAANSDTVSPELQSAIDAVAAKAQAIDDLNPDATT